MKMIQTKIEDIAYVIAGQSPASNTYNKNGIGLPFFQGKTDFGEIHPVEKNWCTSPKKEALPLDILVSVRAPVGPVNIADKKCVIGRGLSALRAKEGISYEYLYYYLKNNQHIVEKYATGSTFKAITQKDLKRIPVNLPKSLTDQKRIAKVLSHCEQLIQKRKQSINLLDDFLKSTFLEMFGDPRLNEKKWMIGTAIDFADCIVPGRDKPKSFTGDIPWVTTNDINNLGFTYSSKEKIGLTNDEIKLVKAKIIPNESVILTCVGDLGIVSIAKKDMVINQQLHSFQCSNEMNNVFLMYALSYQKSFMLKMASKTTVPYLNKTNCNKIPVIKPPIALQNKFASIVEKTETIKSKYQQSFQELENLYGSLSQKAFKGELDLSKVEVEEDEKKTSIDDLIAKKIEMEQKFAASPILEQAMKAATLASKFTIPKEVQKASELASKIYEISKSQQDAIENFTKFTDHVKSYEELIESMPKIPEQLIDVSKAIDSLKLEVQPPTIEPYGDLYVVDKATLQNQIVHIDQIIKNNFKGKSFTFEDLEQAIANEGVYVEYKEKKDFLFKALEGKDALLIQIFDENKKQICFKLKDEINPINHQQ